MTPPKIAEITADVEAKLSALQSWLRRQSRIIVAYSGGVDSAFLLKVACDVLGTRARAFTARSPSLSRGELESAVALAQTIGVEHTIVDTRELDRPGYVENAADRCYHCKTELFDATAIAAGGQPGATVVDGFNADDLSDHRPGHRAAAEHGVGHPLAECGLTKAEVRALSRRLGLVTWAKPQLACLSSRIPYGVAVTEARLGRIERVEAAMRRLGFFDVRARLVAGNDDMVRLEVGADELTRLLEPSVREAVVVAARAAGLAFVTVDLEGFRSGRMNEVLDPGSRLVQIARTDPTEG